MADDLAAAMGRLDAALASKNEQAAGAAKIPADVSGRKLREVRTAALDAIEEAIADGEPPGEVTMPEPAQ